jgi:hypothetical protein
MTSSSEDHGVQKTPSASFSHDVQTAPHSVGHEADHAHGHAAVDEGPHFSEEEWKAYKEEDIHAGGAVICLMAGIFTIGLMLYTTIAIIVNT